MFTENNKTLIYIPSIIFCYLPTIAHSLILLLKFYQRHNNNHNKNTKLPTLNYKTDNQHNQRNWNDALMNIPGLKREKTNLCFISEDAQKSPETLTILK